MGELNGKMLGIEPLKGGEGMERRKTHGLKHPGHSNCFGSPSLQPWCLPSGVHRMQIGSEPGRVSEAQSYENQVLGSVSLSPQGLSHENPN